jgi:prepilin-type N-terminal cleavage/methylation domain-containing protein
MTKRERAFTLIEVLVVVSILGVLMGLVSVLVMRAGSHRSKNDAIQIVKTYLPGKIESFKNEFKKWPPMSMQELNKVKAWKDVATDGANTTNECIEVLVVALRHPDFSQRLEEGDIPGDSPFGNTDEDIFSSVPAGSPNEQAIEILDPWGNPIVYIHKDRYGETVQVTDKEGEVVDVEAIKRADGTYYNRSKFQVICLGPNGKFDEGRGDDITNFDVEDEE